MTAQLSLWVLALDGLFLHLYTTARYIFCRIFIHVVLTIIIAEYLFTENSAYTSILNSSWVALDDAV